MTIKTLHAQITRGFMNAMLFLALFCTPHALAQNAGVEFTLFPANQGNGQMYVSTIHGVSADGDSAAVGLGNAPTWIGWWRRGVGLEVLQPSAFVVNGVRVTAIALNITADGQKLVGTHSAAVPVANTNYVFFYDHAAGLRSIAQPYTPRGGVSGPIQDRLFAPTTDRIVSSRYWTGLNGNPPYSDVVVWTSSTNTWQPLSNDFPPGSYVEATSMSDNGVTVGYLYAGSYFGPRFDWVFDPASGLTLYGDGTFDRPLTIQSVSRDGTTFVGARFDTSPSPLLVIRGATQSNIFLQNGSGAIATSTTGDASFFTVYRETGISNPVEYGVAWADGSYQSGSAFLLAHGIPVPPNTRSVSYGVVTNTGSTLLGVIASLSGRYQYFLLKRPVSPPCDTIDFNNDGLFPTDEDIVDFLTVLAGGTCSNDTNCFDIDFNNDGLFPSDEDLIAFFRVFAGGGC